MLGKVSKQGDSYLRYLLIHGARASLRFCDKYDDERSLKLQDMKRRMHLNKVCVALANKNARIIWALRNPLILNHKSIRKYVIGPTDKKL